jgi:hypothetical protein
MTASATPGTAHNVTAMFSGSGSGGGCSPYVNATSSAATFNLIVSYAPDTQNIQTSVPAGTLDLSTALTINTPLVLPPLALDPSASKYESCVVITQLAMTDTRPGNLPYTMNLIATNLNKVGVTNPTDNEAISGQNLGLDVSGIVSTNAMPNTFLGSQLPGASTAGQNLTGFNNRAGSHVQASDTGSLGLGGTTPHPILHANSGLGTTVVSGTLCLNVPTNVVEGTYRGTATFSIIGS